MAEPAFRTALTRLRLTNFRNYAALALDLTDRSVVLTGANGAGKTNLIEAVSFLAPGRGLRGAYLDDVARDGGDGVGSSRVDLQACKLEYSIVSPK